MSNTDTTPTPILGTSGNDVLRAETSVTFVWLPDPGNSYSWARNYYSWDGDVQSWSGAEPSAATGSMTFAGVSSSEPFSGTLSSLSFSFTSGESVTQDQLGWSSQWTWDPASGALQGWAGGSWDNWIGVSFEATSASFATSHWSGDSNETERGHWELAPGPQGASMFGGAGNDTIYGGQGEGVLSGDDGNDMIYAGRGEAVVLGGAGDDTISGGAGAQTLMGDGGNDLIRAGSGSQTVMGGAGRDTIWAGLGSQVLDGGGGADILHAGAGNTTLSGGAGRDVFAFDSGVLGHEVIADFQLGQDVVRLARGINGLTAIQPQDLAGHISAGASGAVLNLGDATVTFLGMSAQKLTAHLPEMFNIS